MFKGIITNIGTIINTNPDQIFYIKTESRPLSKPICGKKFLGEEQASTAEYLDVFEERRSASTTKLPSEIEFQKRSSLSSINMGDSIACAGVCLTIVDIIDDVFAAQVSKETLKVTNLNTWKIGTKINLEQATKLNDRIDGHLVQGHIDGIVRILMINQNLSSHEIKLLCPHELTKFIAKKGSVTLDGVSLTVNSIINQEFTVNIIPYTWKNTTFQYSKVNDSLNLEVDIIARYLDRLLQN